MRIGGFQKLTLVDYPGKVAALIFTQGCNFRCPYCYNAELVIPACYGPTFSEQEVLSYLHQRRGLLNGVVVSGGEPTVQVDLIEFLGKIKALHYDVKLDTNGSRPEVLKIILDQKLVDYIAMDVKAPLEKYSQVAGVEVDTKRIEKSIRLIMGSGVDYEFRTTITRSLCPLRDVMDIVPLIKGAKRYRTQGFRSSDKMVHPAILKEPQYSNRVSDQLDHIFTSDSCEKIK